MVLGLATTHFTKDDMLHDAEQIQNAPYLGRAEEHIATMDRVIPKEMEQICTAKNLTHSRFLTTLAFPKPSYIENRVFSGELKREFGDLSDVPGFSKNGTFELPKGYGLLVPVRKQGEIVELRFYPMRELLKQREALRAS